MKKQCENCRHGFNLIANSDGAVWILCRRFPKIERKLLFSVCGEYEKKEYVPPPPTFEEKLDRAYNVARHNCYKRFRLGRYKYTYYHKRPRLERQLC